jgi:hypothetical protein
MRPPASEPQILSGPGRDLWDLLAHPSDAAALGLQLGVDPTPLLRALSAAGLVSDDDTDQPSSASDPEPDDVRGPSDPAAEGGGSGDLLVDVLTFWLPGRPDPIRPEPLPDDGWDALMDRARRQRSFGPLCWAVGSGALGSTRDQREEAERYAILGARHALQQEAELLEVHARLLAAGIELRVLKGLAVAHLDHLDPSLRASADIDLLVRPECLNDAIDVMSAAGYRRELPERRPGFDARYGKDVTLQAPDRYEVDLHRLPLAGPLGLSLDLEALWAEHSSFVLGGTELRALDAAGRFAHAAWSLTLTDAAPRLVPASDMVAISNTHRLDPARLDRIAAGGAARWALDDATVVAQRLLGPAVGRMLPQVGATVPSRWERSLLATYPGQGGSKAANLLAGATALPSWRDRARYLVDLLLPARDYRAARRAQTRDPEWRVALRATRRQQRPDDGSTP